MSTTIVTDTSADIADGLTAGLPIEAVPLSITFESETFLDRIQLSRSAFYAKLALAAEYPSTSPPTVEQFTAAFKRQLDRGNDIVCPVISSGFSQTYENALAAARQLDTKNIHVVDTKTSSGGLGLHVLLGAEAAKRGEPANEIARRLESYRAKQRGFFTVPDLGLLGRAGRVAQAQVTLGAMMNVSPILKMDNATGKIQSEAQARSYEKAQELLVDIFVRHVKSPARSRIALGHSNAPELGKAALEQLQAKLSGVPKSLTMYEIGPVVASSSGAGALNIFLLEE